MTLHVGTKAYGRLKAVGTTPIVTKFATLYFFPLWPKCSYYYSGHQEHQTGFPFVISVSDVSISGAPLATIDRHSCIVGYLRACCTIGMIIGGMSIIPFLIWLNERPNKDLETAIAVLVGLFLFSVLVYVICGRLPWLSDRERLIRSYCGELLGYAGDPAMLRAVDASNTARDVAVMSREANGSDERRLLLSELVVCRACIARSIEAVAMDLKTDELLDRLQRLSMPSETA